MQAASHKGTHAEMAKGARGGAGSSGEVEVGCGQVGAEDADERLRGQRGAGRMQGHR